MFWFFFVYIDALLFLLYLYWDLKHRKGLPAEDLGARKFFVKFLMGVLIAIRILKGVFFEDFYDRKFADIYDKRNIAKHEYEHDLCLVLATPFTGAGCYYLVGEDERDFESVCYRDIRDPVCSYEIGRRIKTLKSKQEIHEFVNYNLKKTNEFADYARGRFIKRLVRGANSSNIALEYLNQKFEKNCLDDFIGYSCEYLMIAFTYLNEKDNVLKNHLKYLLGCELQIWAQKNWNTSNQRNNKHLISAISERNSYIRKLMRHKNDLIDVERKIKKALDYLRPGLSEKIDLNYLELSKVIGEGS